MESMTFGVPAGLDLGLQGTDCETQADIQEYESVHKNSYNFSTLVKILLWKQSFACLLNEYFNKHFSLWSLLTIISVIIS